MTTALPKPGEGRSRVARPRASLAAPAGGAALPWGALIWLGAVVAWAVWTPSGSTSSRVTLTPPTDAREIVVNLLLLAPLAAVLAASTPPARGARAFLRRVAVPLVMASVVIEAGQWLLPAWLGRVTSPYDVLLNSAGALAAGWVALALRRAGVRARTIVVGVAALSFGAVLAVLLVTARITAAQLRLEGWTPTYPIAAGDEVGGQRTYLGRVQDATVCAGRAAGEVCAGTGAGAETRRRLAEAAQRSQRVELRASVLSDVESQPDHARIVTFSFGPYQRNATLAQSGRTVFLRVRTPRTGVNGDLLEFHLPDAVAPGEATEVRASYDRGVVTVRSRSGTLSRADVFPMDLLSAWWLARPLRDTAVPARHLLAASALGALVLFLPLGLCAGSLLRPRRAAAGVAAAVSLLSLWGLDAALDVRPAAVGLVAAGTAGALGALLPTGLPGRGATRGHGGAHV